MALSGRRFRRRKKEDIFVDGYFIDHANDVVPGLDRADETFHLFGKDSPETDVQSNYGTLQLAVLDKYTNNALLDLVTSHDPTSTAAREYNVNDLTGVTVFANVKNTDNSAYVKSWMIAQWVPGMPMPSGGPNDKASYSVTGNGNLPRQFHGAWINAKKIASGSNLGVTPVQVPATGLTGTATGIYAVEVRALYTTGGVFQQTVVVPSTTLVTSAGVISWSELTTLAGTELTGTPTHAWIAYLQSGTGVYPTTANTPQGTHA